MTKNTNVNETEPADPFEGKLQRTAAGRMANSRGKLSAALLGTASGAKRVAGYDNNLWSIETVPVRVHTVGGGKTSFTLNPDTEPAFLIAAFSEGTPEPGKALRNRIYGLNLEDCIRCAQPTKSKTAPGRVSVSLSQVVRRVRLGDAYLPARYTEAETVGDRNDLMDAIDQLTPEELATMMDPETKAKIREFVLAGRERSALVTSQASLPPVEEVAPAATDPAIVPSIEGAATAPNGPPALLPDGETTPSAVPSPDYSPLEDGAQATATGPVISSSVVEKVLGAVTDTGSAPPLEEAVTTAAVNGPAASLAEEGQIAAPAWEMAPGAQQVSPDSGIEGDFGGAKNEDA